VRGFSTAIGMVKVLDRQEMGIQDFDLQDELYKKKKKKNSLSADLFS
jgi:hypothetical protein